MFLKVVEIAPNHSLALAGLGRTQRMIGNTDLAEELLLRFVSIWCSERCFVYNYVYLHLSCLFN